MPEETNGHRSTTHVVLPAKGGVAESHVADILAQRYSGNVALAQYKALAVGHANDFIQGVINQKRLDRLIQNLPNGHGAAIVDTGASVSLPFRNQVLEKEILFLQESRARQVDPHFVVTAERRVSDTLNRLAYLTQTTPESPAWSATGAVVAIVVFACGFWAGR